MVHAVANSFIGHCCGCNSPIFEKEGNFLCNCGSLPIQSALLPATWSIALGRINRIEKNGQLYNRPLLTFAARASTRAS
jgi:hypothetical protein